MGETGLKSSVKLNWRRVVAPSGVDSSKHLRTALLSSHIFAPITSLLIDLHVSKRSLATASEPPLHTLLLLQRTGDQSALFPPINHSVPGPTSLAVTASDLSQNLSPGEQHSPVEEDETRVEIRGCCCQ
jgi:hypothetical protein